MAMPSDPASLPEAPAALRAIVAVLVAENKRMIATLRAHERLVQSLRIRIAKLQKLKFGARSEEVEHEIEQLQLALEDLGIARAERNAAPRDESDEPASDRTPAAEPRPRRRPCVSEATPRERRALDPIESCPECGGDLRIALEARLRRVGEDVSELLDMIAAQLNLIEIGWMKKSCRRCETTVRIDVAEPARQTRRNVVVPHRSERGTPPLSRSPSLSNARRRDGSPSVLSQQILQDDVVEHRVRKQALQLVRHGPRAHGGPMPHSRPPAPSCVRRERPPHSIFGL